MWVRVTACDDAKRLVLGTLDSAPVNNATGKLKLGKELAFSFDRIREHRKQSNSYPSASLAICVNLRDNA
jgi:hypothetical protein